jgi:hypothetical protein
MTTITSNNKKIVASLNAIEFVASKGKWQGGSCINYESYIILLLLEVSE